MELKKIHKIILAAFIFFIVCGSIFEVLFFHAPLPPFSVRKFTEVLHHTIKKSDKIVDNIDDYELLQDESPYKSLLAVDKDIAFFIFHQNELLFWNTNQYQISSTELKKDAQWHFIQLSNAYGIYKWYGPTKNTGIVSFIPIKANFPYENDYLKNNFHNRFEIDKNISVSEFETPGSTIISCPDGHFLFCLNTSLSTNNKDKLRTAGFISFGISYLLLIIIYFNINHFWEKKKISSKQFRSISIVTGLTVLICSYLNFPELLFANHFFPPQHYAINQLINSLIRQTVLLLFIFAAILVFSLKVSETKKHPVLQKFLLCLYIFFCFDTLKDLVLHSNISFNINGLKDIHFINIWAQLLIFILVAGLFFLLYASDKNSLKPGKTSRKIILDLVGTTIAVTIYHLIYRDLTILFALLTVSVIIFDHIRHYFFNNRFTFNTFCVFIFFSGIITLFISHRLTEYKKYTKYKIQTENIFFNGNSENDPIAELLLEELDKSLRKDDTLKLFVQDFHTTSNINQYIYQKHLHGFWNKYDVHIYPVSLNSPETQYYIRFLKFTGKKIKETEFYSLPASLYDLSFTGLIDIFKESTDKSNDRALLVFEFQPKRNFRSYSFPDLLINKESDIFKQTGISIAKYENSNLIYSDFKFDWFETDFIFQNQDDGFEKMEYEKQTFYIFTKANTRIVITETTPFSFRNFIFYALFITLVHLFIARVILWLFEITQHKKLYALGLTSKFQLVFTSLLFISFISTLIFSLNYIRSNYRQEQIANLEKKKQYIQKSLQDLYYWREDITTVDGQSLNNNLQELAYRYQTDINIYNNAGELMGSSQSLIFTKNLISRRMSPDVFFSNHTMANQYEYIGELAYLASYADLINGDFLQIGYISIPQYFSQTEINAKIEQFLGAIIQIYLIVIILSIVLILITGRKLAEPLHQLESKMKSMRLGGKNEKIEYKSKDEIGQLVEQYNRTVDELEKSAQLLLASERETAWRTMARQIAHEINNPLTPMKLTIQQLQRTKKIDPDKFDEYFEKTSHTLIEQIDNLARIAGTFSQFARMPETEFTEIDIAQKLISVVNLFKNNYENIDIFYSGKESNVFVSGDAEQIIQVFNNILKNATQSIKKEAKGKIEVKLQEEHKDILIFFTDNGSGIPETIRKDIFKPNFTTKNTGMGLGLSISKNIIENMGGQISFKTEENKGTTFEIKFSQKTDI